MSEKQNVTGDTQRSVVRQLNEIQTMSLSELRKKWTDLFGVDPGKLSKQYLARRLAYRVQELVYGGLSSDARRRLARLADDPKPTGKKTARERVALQPGTRLLRDWHGERYEVVVQEDGFLFQGKKHRSLSAIARVITGRHCGGRRFFGLQPSTKRGDRE